MNYGEAQLAGYTVTEEEYKAIESLIAEEYLAAYKEIDARLAQLYAQYADAKTTDDIYNWLIQFDRYNKLHSDVAALYTQHSKAAGKLIEESSRLAMVNNYCRQAFTLTYASPQMTFSMINPNLVDLAVLGQVELWSDIPRRGREIYGSAEAWLPQEGTLSQLIKNNRSSEIRAIQSKINSGLISGKGYAKTARDVRDVIGAYTGKDPKGFTYNALRIVRTEGNRALNAGAYANDLAAADQGIKITRTWDATLDTRTRPEHAREDGKKTTVDKPFMFANGWSAMYPGKIHTGSAKTDASQNIHCFNGDTLVTSLSDIHTVMRRPYSGEMVTIKTESGAKLTATPNHPILTTNGWIEIGFLNEGDRIFEVRNWNRLAADLDPNIKTVKTKFSNVFDSLFNVSYSHWVGSISMHFDVDTSAEYIKIIRSERKLLSCVKSFAFDKFINFIFKHSNLGKTMHSGNGKLDGRFSVNRFSLDGIMGALRESLSFVWWGIFHSCIHGLRPVSDVNVLFSEDAINNRSANSKINGKRFCGNPLGISINKIVSVNRTIFNGHVYNLHNSDNVYIAGDEPKSNGIIAHNCRCTVVSTAGDYTPALRRGKNPVTGETEVFAYKDFDKWASDNNLKRNKYGRLYLK